jgi:hypothetical protein
MIAMKNGDVVKIEKVVNRNGRIFGHIERCYAGPVEVWHFRAVVYGWPVQPAAGVHASRLAALYAIEDLLVEAHAIREDESLLLATPDAPQAAQALS